MNKKKLALTLLLSSASVSVFAAETPKAYTQAEVDAAVEKATVGTVAQAVLDAANKALTEAKEAATKAATDAKTAYDAVVTDKNKTQDERNAAKAELDKANAQLTALGQKEAGYFASAWAAVKSNQVATAVLVTTAILVGAVVHAAVSSNNDVEADDAE